MASIRVSLDTILYWTCQPLRVAKKVRSIEMSFCFCVSFASEDGDSFWLSRTPPSILSVGSFETDLKTAVGPRVSVPEVGEQPSATGVNAFLPSGVAGTTDPEGTFAEMLDVPA
mgnify:CR=1 FL=1